MSAQKFRRKQPAEVEAMLFTTQESYLHIFDWMKAAGSTFADEVQYRYPVMLIPTFNRTEIANPGDWVIKGVNGVFYPCRNDIFAAMYEQV